MDFETDSTWSDLIRNLILYCHLSDACFPNPSESMLGSEEAILRLKQTELRLIYSGLRLSVQQLTRRIGLARDSI